MISEPRRAWLRKKLHRFFLRKAPSLVRFFDVLDKPIKKQQEQLLEEQFHESLNVVKEKAKPFLWAYLAGCCAPMRHRRKTARSS